RYAVAPAEQTLFRSWHRNAEYQRCDAKIETTFAQLAQRRSVETSRKTQPRRISQGQLHATGLALKKCGQVGNRNAELTAFEQVLHRQTATAIVDTHDNLVDLLALYPDMQRRIESQQILRRYS